MMTKRPKLWETRLPVTQPKKTKKLQNDPLVRRQIQQRDQLTIAAFMPVKKSILSEKEAKHQVYMTPNGWVRT